MSRTPLRRTTFKVEVGNEALPADRWDLHFGLDLLPSLTGTMTEVLGTLAKGARVVKEFSRAANGSKDGTYTALPRRELAN